MHIIFGLGNPGLKYRKTRHNAGFKVMEALAKKLGIKFKKSKFEAKVAEGFYNNEKIMLVMPLTYMNLSGKAVFELLDYYKASKDNILVVVDDMAIPIGSIRIRKSGSSGGHNGLKSITQFLKTDEYARLRVGIGNPQGQMDTIAHVLGKFSKDEADLAVQCFDRAAEAALCVVEEGIVAAQSKYNR